MAIGLDAPVATNPFDDPSDEDKTQQQTSSPTPSTTVVPFIRVPILIICTVLVFILLIAGTATTVLSFPPSKVKYKGEAPLDGDFKLLGPLLLTAGSFLLCVDLALCAIITREAYYASRVVQPTTTQVSAWNNARPMPLSFVGGPFYISTGGPNMTHPSYMSLQLARPWWGPPNAPEMESSPMPEIRKAIRPETAVLCRGRQPPYNPEVEPCT